MLLGSATLLPLPCYLPALFMHLPCCFPKGSLKANCTMKAVASERLSPFLDKKKMRRGESESVLVSNRSTIANCSWM